MGTSKKLDESGGWRDGVWRPEMVGNSKIALNDEKFIKHVQCTFSKFETVSSFNEICTRLGVVNPGTSMFKRKALIKFFNRFFQIEYVEGHRALVISDIYEFSRFPELEKENDYRGYLMPAFASIVVSLQESMNMDDRELVTIHGTPMEWYVSLGLCCSDLYDKNLPLTLQQVFDIDDTRLDKFLIIDKAIAMRRDKCKEVLRNLLTSLHKTNVVTWEETYQVTLQDGSKILANVAEKAYIRASLYSTALALNYKSIFSCILQGNYLNLMYAAVENLNSLQGCPAKLYHSPMRSFKKVHSLNVVPRVFRQFLQQSAGYIAYQKKLNLKLVDAMFDRDLAIVERAVENWGSYLPERMNKENYELHVRKAVLKDYRGCVPMDMADRNKEINVRLCKVAG